MRTASLALCLLAACGDNHASTPPAANPDAPAAPMADAPPTPAAFTITPPSAVLGRNAAQAFAIADGTPVTWSTTAGAIDPATGAFVAPGQIGSYTVTATSVADPTLSLTAEVTVTFDELVLVAGAFGGAGTLDGHATDARLTDISQVISDDAGDVFFTDGAAVREYIAATGEVVTLAGDVRHWALVDGAGGIDGPARFGNHASGLAYDKARNALFVGDTNNLALRRIDLATREVTTPIVFDQGSRPRGMAIAGDMLYMADGGDTVIRAISLVDYAAQILAGSIGTSTDSDVGTGTFEPTIGSVSLVGTQLFITSGDRIRVLDVVTHHLSTIAKGAQLDYARWAIAYDASAGKLYYNHATDLRSCALDGSNDMLVGTLAATPYGFAMAGAALVMAGPDAPVLLQPDLTGAAWPVAFVGKIREAGLDSSAGADGTTARFIAPGPLALDPAAADDTLYVADNGTGEDNGVIRKVAITGAGPTYGATVTSVTTFVDDDVLPDLAFLAPGKLVVDILAEEALRVVDLATLATSDLVHDTAAQPRSHGAFYLAPDGTPYVSIDATGLGAAIARWDAATSTLVPVYGDATAPRAHVDGVGTAARFESIAGILAWDDHTWFVCDGATIRRIDTTTGAVTTVAGVAGMRGHADGALGTSRLDTPARPIRVGNSVYFVDIANGTVRVLDPATTTITTAIGISRQLGMRTGPLRGAGVLAALNQPAGLALLPTGELAISSAGEPSIVVAR